MTSALNVPSLFSPEWSEDFERRITHSAESQLVPAAAVHRLTSVAMAITLGSHQVMSQLGHSSAVWKKLKAFGQQLQQSAGDASPAALSLADMTVVMDMAATAFSLIDARRAAVGIQDSDLPVEKIAELLLKVMRNAWHAAGEPQTAASLRALILALTARVAD